MKTQIRTLLLSTLASTLFFTSTVFAGVEENKSKRAADEAITAELTVMKQKCGNESVNFNVTWDKYDEVIDSNLAKLEKASYEKKWVIDHAGERTSILIKTMSTLCEDVDYKEVIAKINSIEVTPKNDWDEYDSKFTLNDGVLLVVTGHRMKRNADDFEKILKSML